MIKMIVDDKPAVALADSSGERKKGIGKGIRKAIVLIERSHKRGQFKGGGTNPRLNPPHPTLLTIRTDTLRRSYRSRFVRGGLEGRYGSNLIYAATHEYGDSGRNIRARPGLLRTVKGKTKEVEKIMADEIEKGLKDAK